MSLTFPYEKSEIIEEIWNILQLISSVISLVMLQNILKVILWWAVSKVMQTYNP